VGWKSVLYCTVRSVQVVNILNVLDLLLTNVPTGKCIYTYIYVCMCVCMNILILSYVKKISDSD
jgi:hypothetical protein